MQQQHQARTPALSILRTQGRDGGYISLPVSTFSQEALAKYKSLLTLHPRPYSDVLDGSGGGGKRSVQRQNKKHKVSEAVTAATPSVNIADTETLEYWYIEDERFYVPRPVALRWWGRPPPRPKLTTTMASEKTPLLPPPLHPGLFVGILRPHQAPVLPIVLHRLTSGPNPLRCGLCVFPTGWGKTLAMMWLSAHLRAHATLILVNNEDLAHQAVTAAATFLDESVRVFLLQGFPSFAKWQPNTYSIAIALVQTLRANRHVYQTWLQQFDTILVDEAPLLTTPAYLPAILKDTTPNYLIGFSATPMRNDGTDMRSLDLFFGPVLERVHETQLKGCWILLPWRLAQYAATAPPKYYTKHQYLQAITRTETFLHFVGRVAVSLLCANEREQHWDTQLADRSVTLPDKDHVETSRRILILSPYTEPTERIIDLLVQHIIPSMSRLPLQVQVCTDFPNIFEVKDDAGSIIRIGWMVGEHKTKSRVQVKHTCRIICSTYNLFSVGLDIPDIDTVFLLTEVGSNRTKQSWGRCLRYHPTKNLPIFIHFVPEHSPLHWMLNRHVALHRKEQHPAYWAPMVELAALPQRQNWNALPLLHLLEQSNLVAKRQEVLRIRFIKEHGSDPIVMQQMEVLEVVACRESRQWMRNSQGIQKVSTGATATVPTNPFFTCAKK